MKGPHPAAIEGLDASGFAGTGAPLPYRSREYKLLLAAKQIETLTWRQRWPRQAGALRLTRQVEIGPACWKRKRTMRCNLPMDRCGLLDPSP